MALTTTIKRKFAAENGVTFRDLAKHPSLFRKISSCRVPESGSHPLAGRGYPFFGKTIVLHRQKMRGNGLMDW